MTSWNSESDKQVLFLMVWIRYNQRRECLQQKKKGAPHCHIEPPSLNVYAALTDETEHWSNKDEKDATRTMDGHKTNDFLWETASNRSRISLFHYNNTYLQC